MTEVIKEGWLSKLGGIRKNWKKRWFVAYKDALVYYELETRKAEKGRLTFTEIQKVWFTEDVKACVLLVHVPGRVHKFQAPNEAERAAWREVIFNAMLANDNPHALQTQKEEAEANAGTGADADANADAGADDDAAVAGGDGADEALPSAEASAEGGGGEKTEEEEAAATPAAEDEAAAPAADAAPAAEEDAPTPAADATDAADAAPAAAAEEAPAAPAATVDDDEASTAAEEKEEEAAAAPAAPAAAEEVGGGEAAEAAAATDKEDGTSVPPPVAKQKKAAPAPPPKKKKPPPRPRKPSVEDLQAMAETKVATDAAAAEEATAAADVAEPAGGEDLGPEPDLLQDADGGGGDEGDGSGGGDGDDAEADDDDEDGDAIAGLEVEAGEDSVLQRGWMNKRGQMNKAWKKRYFMATNRVVAYYTKEPEMGGELKGGVLPETIKSIRLARRDEEKQDNCIAFVTTVGRVHYFLCKTPAECDEWQATLRTIGKAEIDESEIESRMPAIRARRIEEYGESLRTIFSNFDASGKGLLSLKAIAPMYKLLTHAPSMESVMADLDLLGKAEGEKVSTEEFVEFVVDRLPDSASFEHRLSTSAGVKPLFVEEEPEEAGPDHTEEEALAVLFDIMDEDEEGAVPKSEGFDVLLSLLPKFDMKALRADFAAVSGDDVRTVKKDEFVKFAMDHEATSESIKTITAEVKAEME